MLCLSALVECARAHNDVHIKEGNRSFFGSFSQLKEVFVTCTAALIELLSGIVRALCVCCQISM